MISIKNLTINCMLSYFIVYSALGFALVIDLDGFRWDFLLLIIINLTALSFLFKLPFLSKHLSKGFKMRVYIQFFFIVLLHIYTYIMAQKLGPTLIKLSEQVTLNKTNEFLIKVNIIVLLLMFILSFVIGCIIDYKSNINQYLKSNLCLSLLMIVLIVFTLILWPLISIFTFIFKLGHGL